MPILPNFWTSLYKTHTHSFHSLDHYMEPLTFLGWFSYLQLVMTLIISAYLMTDSFICGPVDNFIEIVL